MMPVAVSRTLLGKKKRAYGYALFGKTPSWLVSKHIGCGSVHRDRSKSVTWITLRPGNGQGDRAERLARTIIRRIHHALALDVPAARRRGVPRSLRRLEPLRCLSQVRPA